MATANLELPENLQIDQRDGQLTIIWKWSNSNVIGIVIALIFVGWMVSNVAGFGEVHWTDLPNAVLRKITHDPFPFNLFVPIFLFAGLCALYKISAHTINHTQIHVSRSKLVVRHSPLPWFGNREIETNTIKQIFTKLSPVRRRDEMATLWAPYDLLAIDRTGNTLKLLSNLNLTGEQARAIEQKIEQFLGIKDELVNEIQIDHAFSNPGLKSANAIGSQSSLPAATAHQRTRITQGSDLLIAQRWRSERTIFMLIFSLVWLSFTGFLAWSFMTRFGSRPLLPIFFESVLIPLGALASIGISMLYVSSAQLINNTQVKLSRAQLTIQHGPLPWLGSGSFPTQNIKSLNVQKSRIGHGNSQQMVFKLEVHMTLTNGKRKKIIGGFDTQGEAQIVQREIESYLRR